MKSEEIGEGVTVVSFDNDDEMFSYMKEHRKKLVEANNHLNETQRAIKPGDFFTWHNVVMGGIGYGYYYSLKETIYSEVFFSEGEELLETGLNHILEQWNHSQETGMVHTVYFDQYGFELGSMHRSYFVERIEAEEFYSKMREFSHEGLMKYMQTITEKEQA